MTPFRPRNHRAQGRGLLHLAAILLLATLLAGCAPAEAGVQRDAARRLQERVLGVSQAAASNDHAAALLALKNLETELASASSNGQVSQERRRTILTVVTAVRADLTAAVEAAESAAAASAAKAAAEAAAADEAEAEAEAAAAGKAAAAADAGAAATVGQENAVPAPPTPLPAQEPGPAQRKNKEGKGKGNNG